MALSPLTALSPLDGRYSSKVEPLRRYFSELALIRYRVQVEIEWLKALAAEPAIKEVPRFSAATIKQLDALVRDFSEADGAAVKAIEARTNHDVKAIEYFLKDKLAGQRRNRQGRRVHPFRLHLGRHQQPVPRADAESRRATRSCCRRSTRSSTACAALAHELADAAMLAHTHGQPASPTTLGKEMANVVARLQARARQDRRR